MRSYEKLLIENKAWAKTQLKFNPNFFHNLSNGQQPDFLWIGCSDSRIPAEVITNSEPGDIFVHRNIANLVINTDLSMLSVLEYAVKHLKIKHIIVCGHYGCAEVKAAINNNNFDLLDEWLASVKDIYRLHKPELDAIENQDKKLDRLVELNVQEQVNNLSKTSIVQKAWKEGQQLMLHGWVYSLQDGILSSLCSKSQ